MKNYLQKTANYLNDGYYLVEVKVNDSYCEIEIGNISIRALDNHTYIVEIYNEYDECELEDMKIFRTQKSLIEYLEYNKERINLYDKSTDL